MTASHARPGYLLIELIAAVVLLSLAVTALLPALSGRSNALHQSELVEQVTDFDRRARVLSLREGPVRLTVDTDQAVLSAAPLHLESIVLRAAVKGWEPRLLDAETQAEITAVFIDRLGRSEDYILLLHDGRSRLILRFEGRTGRVRGEELDP